MLASTLTRRELDMPALLAEWVVPDLAITARLLVGDEIGSTIWAGCSGRVTRRLQPGGSRPLIAHDLRAQ